MDEVATHLEHVDAVMIGRGACDAPYVFADADRRFFDPSASVPTRREVVEQVAGQLAQWQGRPYFKAHHITRHLLNLFAGEPGTKVWKRTLAQGTPDAGPELLFAAWDAAMAARERLAQRRAGCQRADRAAVELQRLAGSVGHEEVERAQSGFVVLELDQRRIARLNVRVIPEQPAESTP